MKLRFNNSFILIVVSASGESNVIILGRCCHDIVMDKRQKAQELNLPDADRESHDLDTFVVSTPQISGAEFPCYCTVMEAFAKIKENVRCDV